MPSTIFGNSVHIFVGQGYSLATSPQLSTPGTLSLTLTTYAPVVSAPRLVTPSKLALVLSSFAPNSSTPRLTTPSKLSLALSSFAPTITVTPYAIPATRNLVLTGYAPVVVAPRLVTPGVRALTLTRYAPNSAAPRLTTPGKLTLTITRYRPVIVNKTYTPGTRHLVTSGKRPNVRVRKAPRNPGVYTPNLRQLTLTRYAPVIHANKVATPLTATHLLVQGLPVLTRLNKFARPTNRDLILSPKQITVRLADYFTPDKLPLVLEFFAPDIEVVAVPVTSGSYAGDETVIETTKFPRGKVLV